jgi:hypothetical protein
MNKIESLSPLISEKDTESDTIAQIVCIVIPIIIIIMIIIMYSLLSETINSSNESAPIILGFLGFINFTKIALIGLPAIGLIISVYEYLIRKINNKRILIGFILNLLCVFLGIILILV